jgi:hypothetical protein
MKINQVIVAYPEERFEKLRPNYTLTDFNSVMIIERIIEQLDPKNHVTVLLNTDMETEYPISNYLRNYYPHIQIMELTGNKQQMLSSYLGTIDSETPILVVGSDIISEVSDLNPGDYSPESGVYFHKNKHTYPTNLVTNHIVHDFSKFYSWKHYNNKNVIFCDIDGTLIEAQPKNMYSDTPRILTNNVDIIKTEYDNGSQIIFTTCRKEEFREVTTKMLESLGFHNFLLIMNLIKGTRILVNDYDEANPFPRAIAQNTLRDSDDLPWEISQ